MKSNFARAISLLTHLGISMLVPILLCIFVGKWIDSKLETGILFLIIFTILGVGSAFRTLYVIVTKTFNDK